jgi:hypothetical protein
MACSADPVFALVRTLLVMLSVDSPSTIIDVRIADVPTIADVSNVETLWEGFTYFIKLVICSSYTERGSLFAGHVHDAPPC